MNKKKFKQILVNLFARKYVVVMRNGGFDTPVYFHAWHWESPSDKLNEAVSKARVLGNYNVIARL